jgi:hypothetical protein
MDIVSAKPGDRSHVRPCLDDRWWPMSPSHAPAKRKASDGALTTTLAARCRGEQAEGGGASGGAGSMRRRSAAKPAFKSAAQPRKLHGQGQRANPCVSAHISRAGLGSAGVACRRGPCSGGLADSTCQGAAAVPPPRPTAKAPPQPRSSGASRCCYGRKGNSTQCNGSPTVWGLGRGVKASWKVAAGLVKTDAVQAAGITAFKGSGFV